MKSETHTRLLRTLRDAPGAEIASWLRRGRLQIEFARSFASLPGSPSGWPALIDSAEARIEALDSSHSLPDLTAAVKAAEAEMAEIGEAARKYTIHCVGHGHIDMNWMWSWPETVATTHDTFASVLSLMDQYPELTYSQSQASVYAIVERYYPEMFERIRQRVNEGRWEIAAAHWVEGDKNLSSGESICRHMLYTRRYIEEKFGLAAADLPVDWEPDTFGHANTVPGILRHGGVKYYYSCRTGGGFEHHRVGEERPRLFYWQSPDGSRVLVNRESTWYNSYVNIGDNIALPMVDFVRETGLHNWLNIYGVGNHGGGPTRTEVDYYLSMRDWPVYPTVVFGTSSDYFQRTEAELSHGGRELPVLAHELNFEFTGCYTSQSAIKRGNRLGENYLEDAEALAAVLARTQGAAYPADRLREAWINILFNQFHDILPGSGVRETREHAQALFQETGAITGSIKRTAMGAIASRIDTLSLLPDNHAGRDERALVRAGRANTPFVAGAGIGAGLTGMSQASGGGHRFHPVLVFNPTAWPRTERVTAAVYDSALESGRIVARDAAGRELATLHLGRGNDWGHDKQTVQFDAVDVPALGYRAYVLCEGSPQPLTGTVTQQLDGWFETPFFRLRLNRHRAGVLELIDKRTGVNLAAAGALGSWQYVVERDRGMTAWVLGEEDDAPVGLKAVRYGVHGASSNQGTAVPHQSGGLGYRVEYALTVPGTESTVRVYLDIHPLEPRLDFTADLDWREIGARERGIPGLTVSFDLALKNLKSRFETPFGSVERSLFNGEEVPTLRYAHVEGTAAGEDGSERYAGVTLLQDSKYGHALRGSDLRMRVVRSSFDPDHAPEVAQSRFRYSLYIHDVPPTPAALTCLGAAFNHPLLLTASGLHEGPDAAEASFARVLTENVVLASLKRPEDGDGLVLRLVEHNGAATDAVVELNPSLAKGLTRAEITDVLEQPTGESARLENGRLTVPIPAFGFTTVVIR